jgi:heme-degrading monooxygenase HmoA
MDNYVWVTTRTNKPGAREHFEHAWRPAEFPPGLVGAYVLYADDGDEVVGISIWDSAEACHRYRDSDVEARRRALMDPFVLEERSRFYTGRELASRGAEKPNEPASASRRTSGLPPGSRRRW